MEDLLAQKAKIEDEIALLERQRAIESLGKSAEMRSVAKQVSKLDLSDDEIVKLFRSTANPKSKSKRPSTTASTKKKTTPTIPAATYQHPENPNTTWSGRGRKPGWILEWIESGKPVEELRKE
jgi:DNA-binding protein H-NS